MVLSHEVQTGGVPSHNRAVNDTYVGGKELHPISMFVFRQEGVVEMWITMWTNVLICG